MIRNLISFLVTFYFVFITNAFAGFTDADKATLNINNLYTNGGAEIGFKGWSETGGGTLALETTTKRNGKAAIKFTSSATSDYLNFPAVVIKKGTNNCEATFYYKTTSNVFDAEVYINSIKVALLDLTSNTEFTKASIPFVCTDFTNNTQVKITNGAASDIIYIDDAEIGEYRGIGSINLQDKQYDISSYVSGNNSWSNTRAVAIPYKTRDGVWRLRLNIMGTSSSAATVTLTFSGGISFVFNTTYKQAVALSCHDGVDSTSAAFVASSTTIAMNASTGQAAWEISGDLELTTMPTFATDFTSQQVVRAENANTAGAAHWSSAQFTTSAGSWTTLSGSYTPTNYKNAVGSGSEYSATFSNLKANTLYKVTAASAFTDYQATCQFRIYDGTNTIASNEITSSSTYYAAGSNLVGYIQYSTLQPTKTFYVQAQKTAGSFSCYSSANNTTASLSLEEVSPVSQMPQIINSVGTTYSGQSILNSVYVAGASESTACSGSPCTTYRETGDWVSSVTRGSTGTYTVNFNTGIFSSTPNCTITNQAIAFNVFYAITAASSTAVTVNAQDAGGTNRDEPFTMICHGMK